jgi:hypothetical protein
MSQGLKIDFRLDHCPGPSPDLSRRERENRIVSGRSQGQIPGTVPGGPSTKKRAGTSTHQEVERDLTNFHTTGYRN